jgi:hypothetical protein
MKVGFKMFTAPDAAVIIVGLIATGGTLTARYISGKSSTDEDDSKFPCKLHGAIEANIRFQKENSDKQEKQTAETHDTVIELKEDLRNLHTEFTAYVKDMNTRLLKIRG